MQVIPYLNFDGRCQEALDFYKTALGAVEEMKMQFKDSPEQNSSPECAAIPPEKIMHASFRIGTTTVMASDCHSTGKPAFQGISLSLALKSPTEAERYFNALAAGGQVCMPLGKTFWSPAFGVVTDKFGVSWMINVEAAG